MRIGIVWMAQVRVREAVPISKPLSGGSVFHMQKEPRPQLYDIIYFKYKFS